MPKKNKLSLNTSKGRELLVQLREGHVQCLTNIPRCDSLKLLGIHVDTKFGFKTHIENLSLKCRQLTFQIKRLLKHACCIREMRLFFNAIVLPQITYSVSVYGGVPRKHLKKHSAAISLAERLLHVTDDTDFYRNLQQSDCKMLRKIMEPEKHSCRVFSSSPALCNREAEKAPTNKSCWFSRISTYSQIAA